MTTPTNWPAEYEPCDRCGDPAQRKTMYRVGRDLWCRDCYEASVTRDTREALNPVSGLKRGYQEYKR